MNVLAAAQLAALTAAVPLGLAAAVAGAVGAVRRVLRKNGVENHPHERRSGNENRYHSGGVR